MCCSENDFRFRTIPLTSIRIYLAVQHPSTPTGIRCIHVYADFSFPFFPFHPTADGDENVCCDTLTKPWWTKFGRRDTLHRQRRGVSYEHLKEISVLRNRKVARDIQLHFLLKLFRSELIILQIRHRNGLSVASSDRRPFVASWDVYRDWKMLVETL